MRKPHACVKRSNKQEHILQVIWQVFSLQLWFYLYLDTNDSMGTKTLTPQTNYADAYIQCDGQCNMYDQPMYYSQNKYEAPPSSVVCIGFQRRWVRRRYVHLSSGISMHRPPGLTAEGSDSRRPPPWSHRSKLPFLHTFNLSKALDLQSLENVGLMNLRWRWSS